MKSTGSVRKVEDFRCSIIPDEIRKVYDYEQKDGIEIFSEGDTIIPRKYDPSCAICNAVKNTKAYKWKLICRDCIEVIKDIAGR